MMRGLAKNGRCTLSSSALLYCACFDKLVHCGVYRIKTNFVKTFVFREALSSSCMASSFPSCHGGLWIVVLRRSSPIASPLAGHTVTSEISIYFSHGQRASFGQVAELLLLAQIRVSGNKIYSWIALRSFKNHRRVTKCFPFDKKKAILSLLAVFVVNLWALGSKYLIIGLRSLLEFTTFLTRANKENQIGRAWSPIILLPSTEKAKRSMCFSTSLVQNFGFGCASIRHHNSLDVKLPPNCIKFILPPPTTS